jgi:hypothetical protein
LITLISRAYTQNLRRVLELDDAPVHPLRDLIDPDNQAEVQMTQTQMESYSVEKIARR